MSNLVKLNVKNGDVISTLFNVVDINVEIDNVASTLFQVVRNVTSTLV